MLQGLPSDVRECLAKAAEARLRSEENSDKEIKAFWRTLEQRWLGLAHSYDQARRTDSYLKYVAGAVGSAAQPDQPPAARPAQAPSIAAPSTFLLPTSDADFLRQQGEEFLRLAEDCNRPDVARELGAIGAELVNEANRETPAGGAGTSKNMTRI